MKIAWSRPARADLVAIDDYIAKDDPIAALEMIEEIERAVGRHRQFPQSGRPGRVAGTRELVVSPFVIAYHAASQRIDILRVIHGSRRWPRRL